MLARLLEARGGDVRFEFGRSMWKGDNDYEMRQCDGCHQVKKNSRMKETIAIRSRTVMGNEATCPVFNFDVDGGSFPASDVQECLFAQNSPGNRRQLLRLDRTHEAR